MPLSLPQLTLALFEDAKFELTDFITGPNQLALDGLKHWLEGQGPWFLVLAGRSGTGKSHLAQAAISELGRDNCRAMYVPLSNVMDYGPSILSDLESIDFIVVDDLDDAAGNSQWEEALFNLFNRVQESSSRLLVSSTSGGRNSRFELADLRSRLASGLTLTLGDLSDGDKQTALQRRAANRGLTMPDNVARYLISRLCRDMHELTVIFERIDAASLSAGRELTIPFIRDVVGID
jgi:DnaA family protein